ncbi:MAG: hypothetical protein JNL58_22075 [Planctomyces sp.]|nr:hypothetical protein [Planctomyces sp.]
MSDVQRRYDKLIDEMPIHVNVARAEEMFQWFRYWIIRQVLAEKGPMCEERLRLEIAMKMYRHEESVRQLIEKALSHVSHCSVSRDCSTFRADPPFHHLGTIAES